MLDIDLARLDGLLALEVVRAITRTLPVVLISSVSGPALGLAAERLGTVAVLRKPFRNADLLDAVARGLAQGNGTGGPNDAADAASGGQLGLPAKATASP